jgi:hypothetical protein
VEMTVADDVTETRELLRAELGVDVPFCVAERAARDARYLYYLMSVRSNPAWLGDVLRAAQVEAAPPARAAVAPRTSGIGVGLSYLRSLARAAAGGFQQVSESDFARRWESCQRCPNLITAPEGLLYHLGRKLITRPGEDQRVCSLCGCFAIAKAKKATEGCPAEDPLTPGFTRWGEKKV